MKAPLFTALALGAALGLSAPAFAQPNTPAAPAGSAAQGARAAPARAQSYTERQLARLHRQLRITPAQQAAWSAFADSTRTAAQHLQQLYRQRATSFEDMNALDNLKNYQQIIQAEAADLGNKVTTFAALYDSLSPEQKATVDRMFRYQEQRRVQRHMARERRFRERARQGGAAAGQNTGAPATQAQ